MVWGSFLIAAAGLKTPARNGHNALGFNLTYWLQVRDPKADPNDTKKLSRDHVVDVRAGGLVTIAGGKWTTYRQVRSL